MCLKVIFDSSEVTVEGSQGEPGPVGVRVGEDSVGI